MFKNMTMGKKIAGLATILIVIAGIIAVVGYLGLSNVVDRLEKADDVNRLIKQTLTARQKEKNYIIRGEGKYVPEVGEQVEAIKKQAADTMGKFDELVNKQQMGQVLTSIGQYNNAFSTYVKEVEQISRADEKMVTAGRDLLVMSETIRTQQKQELALAQEKSAALVNDKLAKADDANRIIKWTLEIRREEKNYILRQDKASADNVFNRVEQVITLAKDMKSRFSQEKNQAQADSIIASARAYGKLFSRYMDSPSAAEENKMVENARKLIQKANEIREEQKQELGLAQEKSTALVNDKLAKADDANRIIKWTLEIRREEKNYILRQDKVSADNVFNKVAQILNLANGLRSRFSQEQNKAQADSIIASVLAYREAFNETVEVKAVQRQAEEDMVAAARSVQEVCDQIRIDQKAKMNKEITRANNILLIGTVLTVGIGILLSVFIIRGITRTITRVVEGLTEGANQLASASGQVSSSSQSMAGGASQQAASIEETSSSMEEMASMTKQNAKSAANADALMKETAQVVSSANNSMQNLTQSMADISKASEDTSKIIKSIDEIAFQTNLLALNAAVEAARAGEVGAGFAVVADEVRNLAMRAAEAANDTAKLIEGTVKKVHDGSELVFATNKAFSRVAKSSEKIGTLVSEISQASNEQSTGIEQVNNAIGEMDRVVQQNAANAEESASAAEEMSAQAGQLKAYVNDLVMLITGNVSRENTTGRGPVKEIPENGGRNQGGKDRKKILARSSENVRRDQMISFDDENEDFKDF